MIVDEHGVDAQFANRYPAGVKLVPLLEWRVVAAHPSWGALLPSDEQVYSGFMYKAFMQNATQDHRGISRLVVASGWPVPWHFSVDDRMPDAKRTSLFSTRISTTESHKYDIGIAIFPGIVAVPPFIFNVMIWSLSWHIVYKIIDRLRRLSGLWRLGVAS